MSRCFSIEDVKQRGEIESERMGINFPNKLYLVGLEKCVRTGMLAKCMVTGREEKETPTNSFMRNRINIMLS